MWTTTDNSMAIIIAAASNWLPAPIDDIHVCTARSTPSLIRCDGSAYTLGREALFCIVWERLTNWCCPQMQRVLPTCGSWHSGCGLSMQSLVAAGGRPTGEVVFFNVDGVSVLDVTCSLVKLVTEAEIQVFVSSKCESWHTPGGDLQVSCIPSYIIHS